jgi:hypothetical protein
VRTTWAIFFEVSRDIPSASAAPLTSIEATSKKVTGRFIGFSFADRKRSVTAPVSVLHAEQLLNAFCSGCSGSNPQYVSGFPRWRRARRATARTLSLA